ncbi:hypothetical protein N7452_000935 [Penicillium brevicompactum]|uniref:L-dopachrome isomerase n=1 Tax=Penicillium brevicompactum TaxID=5074 RepID=A0A9W9R1G9_PENBR|nr:hypothetical protein N7452_000935 [Penicillium brevicompactum]
MKLNEKQSLPRLSTTNIPLFEKPRNVPIPKPVIPDRTSSLFEEQVYDENVGPNVQSEPKPKLLLRKSVEDPAMAKVKKLYYDDAFATRGAHNSPKDRITFESVVVVELKTNMQFDVCMSTALAEFSHALTEVYQRPETSMLVTIDQNANMLFGTTADPAYLLKVSALSSLIAPLTNLRNTSLIQSIIQDLFGIPPSKGVIIFTPLSEDNLATNGSTAREEIDRLERSGHSPSIFKSISRSMSRRLKSSSENSGPLTLGSGMSPGVASVNSGSPAPSPQVEPHMSRATEASSPKESEKTILLHDTPTMGESPKRTPSKSGSRSVTKRESIRSFVNRRLKDFGEVTPFGTPRSPTKGGRIDFCCSKPAIGV